MMIDLSKKCFLKGQSLVMHQQVVLPNRQVGFWQSVGWVGSGKELPNSEQFGGPIF